MEKEYYDHVGSSDHTMESVRAAGQTETGKETLLRRREPAMPLVWQLRSSVGLNIVLACALAAVLSICGQNNPAAATSSSSSSASSSASSSPSKDPRNFTADPWLPGFHFVPFPFGWQNDPNGPMWDPVHELYHLFYQYQTPRQWGHAVR